MSDGMMNREAVTTAFRKKVDSVKIDWNKWYPIVQEAMTATQFDEIAIVCDRLAICEKDEADNMTIAKAGSIRSAVERVIECIIRLYELKWDGKEGTRYERYEMYGNIHVLREYDTKQERSYYGKIDLDYRDPLDYRAEDNATILSSPYIEVALKETAKNELWFEINFVLVGQVF